MRARRNKTGANKHCARGWRLRRSGRGVNQCSFAPFLGDKVVKQYEAGKNREPAQTESSDFHSDSPDLSHLLVAATAATKSASVETETVIKMVIQMVIRPSNPLPKQQAKAVIVSPSSISN